MTVRRAAALALALLLMTPAAGTAAALAEYQLGEGWATFGLVLPRGAARDAVAIGALPTQTDVKTTWPDGSIRFAVVSASIPRAGRYTISPGPVPRGRLSVALPAASVDITVGGSIYSASLPSSLGDVWLDGPLVREGRAVAVFQGATGSAAELRATLDVRSYVDGTHRLDVSVSNHRNVATAGEVAYGLAVRINGRVVLTRGTGTTPGRNPIHAGDDYIGLYQSAGHGLAPYDYVRLTSGPKAGVVRRVIEVRDDGTFRLNHPIFSPLPVTWEKIAFLHPYMARWRRTFRTGPGSEASVIPDLETFHQAGALPRYLDSIVTPRREVSANTFDLLRLGDVAWPQGMAGDRPDIGLYPAWIAEYVVGRREDQRNYMIAMADASAAISVHIDDSDGSMLQLDRRPDFFLGKHDPRGIEGYAGAGPEGEGIVYFGEPGSAHQPSLAYVPYLVTGDRFYLDEMKYWANYAMISWLWQRRGADGLITGQESRAIAWGLRSLVDLVAYMPDADPHRDYFATRLQNNLADLERLASLETDTLGGSIFDADAYKAPQAFFMQSFCIWAFDHVGKQGFPVPSYRDRLVRYWASLFDAPGFDRRYVPSYHQFILNPDTRQPFKSAAELFAFNKTPPGEFTALPPELVGYYGVNAQLILMIAREIGVPNARARYDELMNTTENGVTIADDVNRRPQYAISGK